MSTIEDEAVGHVEVLRLLFSPLQSALGFEAVGVVVCEGRQDTPTLLIARMLSDRFASQLSEDLVKSFRQFSAGSHQRCSEGVLQIIPLDKPTASSQWDGPALSVVDAPLIVGGRVAGLTRVLAAGAGAFTPGKAAVIYATAQQASTLLERLTAMQSAEKSRLESLVDGLQDGIAICDEQLKVVLMNTAGRRLMSSLAEGCEQGDTLPETVLAGQAREALQGRTAGERRDYTFGDEGQRHVSAMAAPLSLGGEGKGVVLVLREVTEERLMQERLLQSEKMASVGQLVSGVAHELNNPLTGVCGFAQVLLARDLDQETRQALETILSEAERAAKIVENLLSFARRKKAQKGLVDLNALLQRVLELRSYDLRVKNIEVELDLDARLPRTMADPDQIQQVFFNILTNAEHAMLSAHGGGKLKVRSRSEKGLLRFSFADNGIGIPNENLHRVFDPFFTTKEGGEGTGLGLTICYGIMDDHGGRIRVESRTGRGATFSVELPVVEGPELPAAEREESRAPIAVDISRRILVVDDEESILSLLRGVLTDDGHRVDTARNGEEALALVARHGYDLLITDIKMPGMSGQALYLGVKEVDSELARNTVFITGDTVNAETRNFLHRVENPCLEKPFKVKEIRDTVRRVLEG